VNNDTGVAGSGLQPPYFLQAPLPGMFKMFCRRWKKTLTLPEHKQKENQMKLKLLFTSMMFLFLFSCRNKESRAVDPKVIDVEHALQNLTRLKVSDFGKTVRYIPLETTDDSLVGDSPIIKVLRNHIVIEYSPNHCLLFGKEDGRFIAEIGHAGQDPEAFSAGFSWTDEKEEFLYFVRMPDQLVKYDMKGNFCGKVKFSFPGTASCYLITDSEIVGYFDGLGSFRQWAVGLFDREGNLKDTILPLFPKTRISPDEINNISVFRGNASYEKYGNWARSGAVIIDSKNDERQIIAPNTAKLWKSNGNIRFREDFADTLYTISGSKLVPSTVFHTGKYRWPVEERMGKRNTGERVFIADVSENSGAVFFQCIKGMYSDSPVLYNGLYDRKTGKTKLDRHSDGIEDDLTGFMPFTPSGMSTAGEFVSIVEAGDIMEWLEKHPEAISNKSLSFLKELDEDMNPVIILIE
jgi:hypothetical protein